MLPTTRADWAEQERIEHAVLHVPPSPAHCLARCRSEEQVLYNNATWLLEHLYEPNAESGYKVGCIPSALHQEPVNWGDLYVAEVIRHSDGWMLTLEEASPGDCPTLCEYVRSWLERWGWPETVVQTEW